MRRPSLPAGRLLSLADLRLTAEGGWRSGPPTVQGDEMVVELPAHERAQPARATKALQQVGLLLLDEHIRHCVLDAAEQCGDIAEQRFDELQPTLRQALRL